MFCPDMNLFTTMGNMFAAGSETTSSTLRWMILHMAHRPDVSNTPQLCTDLITD